MKNKLNVVIEAINRTKGEDIIVYDFTSVDPLIDRVIICSANNIRQVSAIAHNIKEKCKEYSMDYRVEGDSTSKWLLIDLDTIIVHVFLDDERAIYRLERLYGDLPQLDVNDDL